MWLQEAPVRMVARGGLFLSILVALAHNPCPQVFTFCLLGAYSAVQEICGSTLASIASVIGQQPRHALESFTA